jgi:signal transduction histidine kinase
MVQSVVSWLLILKAKMSKQDPYKQAYERERQARLLAEQLLDDKTRSLYNSCIELESTLIELQTTQNQLIQSEKMASIGQLAAGVAHEINNPIGYSISNLSILNEYIDSFMTLDKFIVSNVDSSSLQNVVKAYLELREQENIDYINSDIKPMLDDTQKGLDRVKEIVSNLNKVSHSGGGDKTLCNINNLIDESLKAVWNELRFCSSINKVFAKIPDVFCHPSEITQVLLNILINAAHANENKGALDIISAVVEENGQDYVTVTITDNGVGIPQEILNKIFDPFFTTKPVGVGTGLGLSISFGIIKKHQGKINVVSDEGQGTTFTIYLPVD